MLSKVRHWLGQAEPPPEATAAFSVTCACGRVIRGTRGDSPQTLCCPQCGAQMRRGEFAEQQFETGCVDLDGRVHAASPTAAAIWS